MRLIRCRQLDVAYKRLRKIDGAKLLNNGCFGTAGGHWEWQSLEEACVKGSHWLVGPRWWQAYELIQIAKSDHFGALCWTGPSFEEEDCEKSHFASPNSSPHHARVLCNRSFSKIASWSVRYLPVITETRVSSSWSYLCDAQIHNNSLHCGWTGKH